jgi:hypothetical protein
MNTQREDPIRRAYFDPLVVAEFLANFAFYVAAALSIAVLAIDRGKFASAYAVIQIAFLIAAISGFFISIAVRLYFSPRAQDVRFADFLSSAFGVRLTPDRTVGYYNTALTAPLERVGAQALENSFFTKEIVRRMCLRERVVFGLYVVVWLVAFTNRTTAFDLMIVASQIVFSEQLISRFVRLEWLRGRTEDVFERLYRLLQSPNRSDAAVSASIVQELVAYENTKSNAAITLSAKIFDKVNPELSASWAAIRADLGL